jgi:glycosyltransferase involved in cell wall biosynthesis
VGTRVSVILPVRNRRDLLGATLDGLDRQVFRDFEIFVIDDGSTDGTVDMVHQRAASNLDLHLAHSGGAGAVGARRLGIAKSSGEIIAFIDSDCVPDPLWLLTGVAAVDSGAGLVNGQTLPARGAYPFERTMCSIDDGLYPTCNLFIRRELFERFGGFDEQAVGRLGFRLTPRLKGTGFGEDTLLAWQIRRHGVECRYVPESLVSHHVFPPEVRESLSRAMQAGAFPALVREVPELRDMFLYRRYRLGERSRFPFYATVVFVLLGSRRAAAVAIAWWVLRRARELRRTDLPRGRKVALLPAEMAMDALVGTALVAGSIRTRTAVL